MKLNFKKVLAAAKRAAAGGAYVGYCIKCGKAVKGIEPDARKYACAHCGATAVYGAEELVMMLA